MNQFVHRHYAQVKSTVEAVVTIGSFDGLHLGHAHLLNRAKVLAEQRNLAPWVLTFEPHPARALAPDRSPPLLMGFERKMRALGQAGFSVLAQEFDQDFAKLSPEDFARKVLGVISARMVVVGDDFTFGWQGAGRAEDLLRLGEEAGFGVEVVKKIAVDGMIASSTRIRAFLLQGQVEPAAALLGRPYLVAGRVEKGQGRGRALGVPTANLCSPAELLPARGVYVGWAFLSDGEPAHLAVTNIGVNPTFGPGPRTVESHLLDYEGELLDRPLALAFAARIRDEGCFDGPASLVAQIEKDIEQARFWAEFRPRPTAPHALEGILLDMVRCG
ncbi:MAG: riboflavin biosynthesis protein RibF [Deltaproteobacteria bacterium]|nr:riboflavin biosynthesis protein RibF [Deltaproteobacteria bacterium]